MTAATHAHAAVAGFSQPDTLEELVATHERLGARGTLVAGATDLGVQMRRHLVHPQHLVSVLAVEELQRLDRDGGVLVLGGAVTHRRVERSPQVPPALAALKEACATVGGVQTRNVGTLAGNIANASPAADTPPVLLAFDASLELVSSSGVRVLGLDEVFLGYRRTALAGGEVLAAVRVPLPAGPTGSSFVKLGRRRAMEISVVCVAARVTLDGDTIADAGIGLGAVGATPLRARAAEDLLRGTSADGAAFARAAEAAAEVTAPISDHRASARYRRTVVPVLVRRALGRALERALEEGGGSR